MNSKFMIAEFYLTVKGAEVFAEDAEVQSISQTPCVLCEKLCALCVKIADWVPSSILSLSKS